MPGSSLYLDEITKEQAEEYANTEGEIRGFKRDSEKWNNAFREYLKFAVGTMAVGRNPRNFRYKVVAALYPDIFGQVGFAGKVAHNYIKPDTDARGIPLNEVQARILSSVMNLAKLFENGIMGVKNSAVDQAGPLKRGQESEMQLPNKADYSDEEYAAIEKDVIYHWISRDIIIDAILESLIPFFNMSKNDVQEIMNVMQWEDATMEQIRKNERAEHVKSLRAQIKHKMNSISYKKLVLG